jgi:hypothetical protein
VLSAIVRVSSLEGKALLCPNQLDLSSVADLNTTRKSKSPRILLEGWRREMEGNGFLLAFGDRAAATVPPIARSKIEGQKYASLLDSSSRNRKCFPTYAQKGIPAARSPCSNI